MSVLRFARLPESDKESTDDPGTGLRFTDVLFGFVFAQLFTRLTDWQSIDGITRAHLLMSATLVLASYIGFRNSLKRGDFKIRFFNLPFFKFATDQVMVVLYFLVATATPTFDSATWESAEPALVRTDVRLVVFVALLYLIWDLLSWRMCRAKYAIEFDEQGLAITTLFLAASVVLLLVVELGGIGDDGASRGGAIAVEVALIGLLLAYRFLKDHRDRSDVTKCRP